MIEAVFMTYCQNQTLPAQPAYRISPILAPGSLFPCHAPRKLQSLLEVNAVAQIRLTSLQASGESVPRTQGFGDSVSEQDLVRRNVRSSPHARINDARCALVLPKRTSSNNALALMGSGSH